MATSNSGSRSRELTPNPFALESEWAVRKVRMWRALRSALKSLPGLLFFGAFAALVGLGVWNVFYGPADGSSRSNPEYYGWTGTVGGGWKLRVNHASEVGDDGRSRVVALVKLSRTADTSGVAGRVLVRMTLRGSDKVARPAVSCRGLDRSPITPTERIQPRGSVTGAVCFAVPGGDLSHAYVMVSRPPARPVWFALQQAPSDPGG
jgi:hypothetical protein